MADASPLSTIGATFTDHGDNTGSFNWTPTSLQTGQDFTIVFKAEDPSSSSDTEQVIITVPAPEVAVDVVRLGDEVGVVLTFTGILQQSTDGVDWTDVSPQPESPWTTIADQPVMLYRAR